MIKVLEKLFKNKFLFVSLIVVVLAFLLRFSLFLAILIKHPSGFFRPDSYEYWQIAENILYYASFSQSYASPLLPDDERTPIYPFFIAILRYIGLDAPSIVFIQVLLSTFNCLGVILLMCKLGVCWQAACLAGGILALDIPSIALSNSLLTETLLTSVLILSTLYLVFYLKKQKNILTALISGGLMGIAILCHPIVCFLPLFLITCYFLPRRRLLEKLLPGLYFLLICFLVVSLWLVRNKLVFGHIFLCSKPYDNLFYYRAAGVYAEVREIPLSKAQEILTKKAKESFSEDIIKEPIKYKIHQGKMAASIILNHPFTYIKNHIRGVFFLLFSPLRSSIDLQLGLSKTHTTLFPFNEKENIPLISRLLKKTSRFTLILVIIQMLVSIILWSLFIYGIYIAFLKKDYLFCYIILSIIVYSCIVTGGPEANARFRVPIVPFLAIGSALGLINIYYLFSKIWKKEK